MDNCFWFCQGQRNLGLDISKTKFVKHTAEQQKDISFMTPIFTWTSLPWYRNKFFTQLLDKYIQGQDLEERFYEWKYEWNS